jgi:hypothetical protein
VSSNSLTYWERDAQSLPSVFDCTPSGFPGFPACEPSFCDRPYSRPCCYIQHRCTANFRAMATFAFAQFTCVRIYERNLLEVRMIITNL